MRNTRHLISVLLIGVIAVSVYANTLMRNNFVYDDSITVFNNSFIKNISNLPKLFKRDYLVLSGELSYRPVVTFTYFLDYAIYDLKPWGYHLTNILLHAANCLFLYIFLLLLTGPLKIERQMPSLNIALTASLLFSTHPILTEAVNAISFREDLLAFLFYLATLCLYLILKTRQLSNRKALLLYLLSCFMYSLSLLSKEMAVTLPLIPICIEWLLFKGRDKALFYCYDAGYLLITLVYFYLRFSLFSNPLEETIPSWAFIERIITVPWLILSYLKLTIFPIGLSADYVISPVKSLFSSSFIYPFVIVGSLAALVFRTRARNNLWIFGILFFVITLIPIYNIVPIGNPFAVRYLYLPSAGIMIIAGTALNRPCSENRRLSSLLLLLIVCTYSFVTINRNQIWKDSYSLWADTIKRMPTSSLAHNNLGNAYARRLQFDKAIKEYEIALQLNPNYAIAHANLGDAYFRQGLLGDAIKEFKIAINLSPNEYIHHDNLGKAYDKQKRTSEAIQEYNMVIKLKPDYPEVHINLGALYAEMGNIDAAIQEFKIALKKDPELISAHYNLGIAYLIKGLKNEARVEFETLLILKPDFLRAQKALSSLSQEK